MFEPRSVNFKRNDMILDDLIHSERSEFNSERLNSVLKGLDSLIEEKNVDGVQNCLEEAYSLLFLNIKLDSKELQAIGIVPKLIFICQSIGSFPYIQSLSLRIMAYFFHNSRPLLLEFCSGDFFNFLQVFLTQDFLCLVRPSLDIICCLLNDPETLIPARESGLVAQLLDFCNTLCFDLSRKKIQYLRGALWALDAYFCTEPDEEFIFPIIEKISPILSTCIENQCEDVLIYSLRLTERVSKFNCEYIINETTLFPMILNLLNTYEESPVFVREISWTLSYLLLRTSKEMFPENYFECINPENYVNIFTVHKKRKKVITDFAVFVNNLLLKAPDAVVHSLLGLEMLKAIDDAYKHANMNARIELINLYWMIANNSTTEQLQELIRFKSFRNMLDIFKYEDDFLARVAENTVMSVLSTLRKIVPMSDKIWYKIYKRTLDAEDLECEHMRDSADYVANNIRLYYNHFEEEEELERLRNIE